MTYAETTAWLDSLGEFHMAFGLDRIRALLARLGNPETCAPAVHVAGTNGKGATCAFVSSILRAAGKKAGLYTSPHLSRPNERIAVDGAPIGDADFAAALSEVRDTAEPVGIELTFFEVLTAGAFAAFRRAKVDAMAVEVGLGGRLDATNVLDPAVSVITHVSLDHTQLLGDSVAKIAAEKAGIVKQGRPLVCAARDPEAVQVIEAAARDAGSRMFLIDRDFEPERTRASFLHWDSAAAAVAAVRILDPGVPETAIERGLERVRWPGRGEMLLHQGIQIVLDGAHNPGAAAAIGGMLDPKKGGTSRPTALLIACMADKDVDGILRGLLPLAPAHVICTSSARTRSLDPQALYRAARAVFGEDLPVHVVPGVREAFDTAVRAAGGGGRVVVTGSLYLVGIVRERLLGPPEKLG